MLSFIIRTGSDFMHSERLLRGMHRVVSHDLPNQVVAVRSLLQLLSQEESSRLSDDGREYLRRLQGAARRAAEMARFLKEMERLQTFTSTPGTVTLADLARELQADLKQRHPACLFEFSWHWHAPDFAGDPRVYSHALCQVFAGLLSARNQGCRVAASSDRRDNMIELQFTVEETLAPTGDATARGAPAAFDERMEIILARAWLALAGADLEFAASTQGAVRFSLLLPSR